MLKVNFRCHTPKKRTFWEVENLPFFENISFAGLKSKFLSTQQKFYMSPTHPINMSSIGLKLMKLEQSTFSRFYFPVTVWNRILYYSFSHILYIHISHLTTIKVTFLLSITLVNTQNNSFTLWSGFLRCNFQVKLADLNRMYIWIYMSLHIHLWCKTHLDFPKILME